MDTRPCPDCGCFMEEREIPYFPDEDGNPKHFKRPASQYKGGGRTIKINTKQMSIFAEVS